MSTAIPASRKTSFYVLELEFETPSSGVAAADFATVLTSLEGAVP